MQKLPQLFDNIWYHCRGRYCGLALLLVPFSLLFYLLSGLRRRLYRMHWLTSRRLPVPVIVVGNISVGGTGKTPMVTHLAAMLSARGYTPGVVSRGYGGNTQVPRIVEPDSSPELVGDEAILLARRCQCPVVVGPDRFANGERLLAQFPCDVIICDDGLQHYALARDIEIIMLDGQRGLGNRLLLPAGPLRETAKRLLRADLLVSTGDGLPYPGAFQQQLRQLAAVNLTDFNKTKALRDFSGETPMAIAGIGHPQRFFSALQQQGLDIQTLAFADHHPFSAQDFLPFRSQSILMTEKDAVKCSEFAQDNMWFVPIEAVIDAGFDEHLLDLLQQAKQQKQSTEDADG